MHFAIASTLGADADPGVGMFSSESGDDLAARLNTFLASLAGTVGLADASIAGVGGGREYAVDLTLKLNNGAGSDAIPSAPTLMAFVFTGATAEEIEAKRVRAYLAFGPAVSLYLDKTAASSNGRHFANLQIVGGARPA